MKRLLSIIACMTTIMLVNAQSVVDNFVVGPYIVEYSDQGDVKYRLREDVNLYEYFELKKDTTVVMCDKEIPLNHAFGVNVYLGFNGSAGKDLGLQGVWKKKIATNLYFNAGLQLALDIADFGPRSFRRSVMEAGVPLQIEWGKLNHERAGLYGLFSLTPSGYFTLSATKYNAKSKKRVDDIKKSGMLVSPQIEFGGNIPVGNVVMRIGAYFTYKINCTPSDYNIYREMMGSTAFGARIGLVL